ncbi:hypothetical protein [Trinickia symbiotica]|uniref:hypothetical protein n=1 Tax=Trinickia symbiotica TaxID=863227 RepID=UPI000377B00A|nr:hypothetical protein [Trinickia symbiotica]
MIIAGQTPPLNVSLTLVSARAERGAVASRHVERDEGIATEFDLLFALEGILERADQARQAAESASLAVDMAVSLTPDDAQVIALQAHALAGLAVCEQWVADAADAVTQSTQRMAARRQAVELTLRL